MWKLSNHPGAVQGKPDPELLAWLKKAGLDEDAVLAVIPNAAWDKLSPDERRLAHGLLEAAFELKRKESDERPSSEEGTGEPE